MKAAFFVLALAACGPYPPATAPSSPSDAPFVGGLAAASAAKQIANPPPDTTALAWKLEIAGGRARFHACSDEQTCGTQIVDVAAKEILATKVVARLDDGDVTRLTLAHPLVVSRGGSTGWDPQRGIYER